MILEFSSSEVAKLVFDRQEIEINDKTQVEIQLDWNTKFRLTLDDKSFEFYPTPVFQYESFVFTMAIQDHVILRFKSLTSTIPISSICLFEQTISTRNSIDIVAKERQYNRSNTNLNDEITTRESNFDEGMKCFDKCSYKRYDQLYFAVNRRLLKSVIAFNKPFQVKFDDSVVELHWQVDFNSNLDKCHLLFRSTSKILFEISSKEPIFVTAVPVIGVLDDKLLTLPKYDYSKVIKHISDEMMVEIYNVHTLMFGTQDRVIEKQDYQLFKDKLECLGIIEKYKKAFQHILQQNTEQESFEKSYMDLSQKIKEHTLQKKFNNILDLNQHIPYLESIHNSIFIAKATNDVWSLDFYYDQVLVYNTTLQGKLEFGRYLMFVKKYDQAFELFLSLVNCCELELAVCEFHLGHLDSSLYRCLQAKSSLEVSMFLYFTLKQENAIDALARLNGIVSLKEIEDAVILFDEMGLFTLSDELLRTMVSRHPVVSILIKHLFITRRFEDAKLICNDDYIQYKVLANLITKEEIQRTDIQKLQSLHSANPTALISQALLWVSIGDDVYFENWSLVLQQANCPIIYEMLWNARKYSLEVNSLIERVV